MITTAQQAFTFCAGSVASSQNQQAKTFATVFRGLADLCSQIPCELPGPGVVAWALLRISQDGAKGQSETWRELGNALFARIIQDGSPVETVPPVHDAIWLWQMLQVVANARLAAIPQVMGDNNTGQLFIMKDNLQIAIGRKELAEIQHEQGMMGMLSEGLHRELRTLIEQLCPERTAQIKKNALEQQTREKAARDAEQGDLPQDRGSGLLTIAQDN